MATKSIDPAAVGVGDARTYIDATLKSLAPKYAEAKLFYAGDHWQNGHGWVGPVPQTDEKDSAAAMARISRAFVSQNAVLEVVSRHVAGVIGREPNWILKPITDTSGDDQTEAIAELDQALISWWDKRKILIQLQDATAQLLLGGRVCLRLFVPAGHIDEAGVIKADDFRKALDLIHVDVVNPDSGAVYRDAKTMKEAGLYLTVTEDGGQSKVLEVSYVGADGNTIVRLVSDKTVTAGGLALGGAILMHEMRRSPLVTDQVLQNQKTINKSLTMWSTNMDWSAFVERTFLNAQPPGVWKKDANGEEKFEATQLKVGPGHTNFIAGVESQTVDGGKRSVAYANPDLVYREPFETATFETTTHQNYRNILQDTKQLHAFIAGEATPSGESRVQAMADFISDLRVTKTRLDACGRWLLDTVIRLANAFSTGTKGADPDHIQISFECILNPGPVPAEQSKQVLDQYKAKLKSRQTAMSEIGIDDPDAEATRIDTAIEDVTELFNLIRTGGLNVPTLMKQLIRIAIQDKEILAGLEEATLNTIYDEIDKGALERARSDASLSLFGA